MAIQQFQNVTCPVCACLCDDLCVSVENDRIVRAERACSLAEPWFLQQNTQMRPVAEIDGQPASLDEALAAAREILSRSVAPLIYGLSRSSTEGQRAAVELADQLGATVDTTASLGHGTSVMAVQAVGESTCTLGEARTRADLVLFWGTNPAVTHPRHLERYSAEPASQFLPNGRKDRTIIVLDAQETETVPSADQFIRIDQHRDYEVLSALRMLIGGRTLSGSEFGGVSRATLEELSTRMRGCKYGVVFFGFGLSRSPLGHQTVEALLRMVSELNAQTRFCARRMRGSGDVTGADSVLAWQTGYPFSVNLARTYPRYNPGEFTALHLCERREVDSALFVGTHGLRRFSPPALEYLTTIPTITLDAPTAQIPWTPTVRFTTATYGIHSPGTGYRMDEVPIPLKAVLPTSYPTDGDVLQRLSPLRVSEFFA